MSDEFRAKRWTDFRRRVEFSPEMVYRSLYFFTQAYHRGEASDPVAYLAAKPARFGILKRAQAQPRLPPRTHLDFLLRPLTWDQWPKCVVPQLWHPRGKGSGAPRSVKQRRLT